MDSPRQAFAHCLASTRSAGCRIALAALALIFALPEASQAQYFGRNKVQYEQFDFKVLSTQNWEIHYYPQAEEAAVDMARMAERWYERFARAFQHEFDRKKPLIIYADHPDFQQTNTLSGSIGQGTGGVTESLKNRVIMPLTASYRETDRILGHELVHAFQYNIAQGHMGGGIMSLARLPLWVVEGMAEYMSLGREHPHTAMWLRDHVLRDDKPTLAEITRNPKYFAYRFGQGLMSYLGGTYGDDAVQELYRTALQTGWEPAIEQVFGMPQDSLSMQWWDALESAYLPLMAGRTEPYETGDLLLCVECGAGRVNVAPSISPDGRYIVFQSEKDLFSMDLFLADVETGRILRPLQRNQTPYIDGVRYIDTSGSWSPDGRKLAFVIQAGGDNQLAVLDLQSGDMESRLLVDELGAIQNPAWSPDGRTVAFTGAKGGATDLYLWDIASGDVQQLTNDKYADLQPAWSPDGKTLVFVSDRADTDFSTLSFGNYSLAFLNMETLEVGHRTVFAGAKHTNPVFDRTGEGVFFVSDADGFPDIYHMALAGGDLLRITRTATGVSGITMLSPAFTYSPEKDLLAFSIFHERGYIVNTGTPGEMATLANVVANGDGRMLPPKEPAFRSRVAEYLDDDFTGLAADSVYLASQAEDYSPSLQLDYVGQPSLGIGADTYGHLRGRRHVRVLHRHARRPLPRGCAERQRDAQGHRRAGVLHEPEESLELGRGDPAHALSAATVESQQPSEHVQHRSRPASSSTRRRASWRTRFRRRGASRPVWASRGTRTIWRETSSSWISSAEPSAANGSICPPGIRSTWPALHWPSSATIRFMRSSAPFEVTGSASAPRLRTAP